MIVYTSPFILSQAATATPLTHPRFGYQTWLRDLDAAAVTVSGETESGPRDMPLRTDTAKYWEPDTLPATWVADLGATRDVDYVGIGTHTLGTARASVLVETSIDDGVWAAVGAEALPANNAPLLFLDESRQARKVRLTLTGVGGVPKIGPVYAGEILAMPYPIYGGHSPLSLSRSTVLKNTLSRGGQFLGQDYQRHGVEGAFSFRHLTAAWYRENFDPFVRAARKYPYFAAWRPQTFPLECAYVWTGDNIRPSNMGLRDFMTVSFPASGIGHE